MSISIFKTKKLFCLCVHVNVLTKKFSSKCFSDLNDNYHLFNDIITKAMIKSVHIMKILFDFFDWINVKGYYFFDITTL